MEDLYMFSDIYIYKGFYAGVPTDDHGNQTVIARDFRPLLRVGTLGTPAVPRAGASGDRPLV